jgi:hypothetical protein
MPVALIVAVLIVASMLALTTPSHSLSSCMSKSEARQHYGSAHLYWHGPDHCWDATPGRHRLVRKNQSNVERKVQRGRDRSDWRQAMSEMRPDDPPVQAPDTRGAGGVASANWLHRWIDIEQVVPRLQTERRPSEPAIAAPVLAAEPEAGGMPHVVVVLAFFAFLLIFATFEILLRNDEQQK